MNFWFAGKSFNERYSKLSEFLKKKHPKYGAKLTDVAQRFKADFESKLIKKFPHIEADFKVFLRSKMQKKLKVKEAEVSTNELSEIENKIQNL
jgi:ABC-type Zn uptake system ZnuABC Zn-binding protein ZnuA